MTLFEDREQAGRELSKFLAEKVEADTVVIPHKEASDVGFEVAQSMGADIEFRLSEFVISPDAPYAEFGSVVEDGTL